MRDTLLAGGGPGAGGERGGGTMTSMNALHRQVLYRMWDGLPKTRLEMGCEWKEATIKALLRRGWIAIVMMPDNSLKFQITPNGITALAAVR